jgi:hypothetical protein
MATIASNTTLCTPLSMPDIIPGANTTQDFCVTPYLGNSTQIAMQECCGYWRDIYNSDGCSWCYTYFPDMHNNSEFTDKFSYCISEKVRAMNATTQGILRCSTPSLENAAAAKGVKGWKVGVVVVLLGVASLSL